MILRGRDRLRQMRKTELFKARQKSFLLLAAKHPEHELGGIRCSAPRHHRENEPGETGVVEIGDGPPSLPFSRDRCFSFSHVHSRKKSCYAVLFGWQHSASFMCHEIVQRI